MPRNLQGTVLAGTVHKGHEDSIAKALDREARGALVGMTREEEPELTVVFNIRGGEFAEKWIPLEVDYHITGKADLMAVADAPADKEGWVDTRRMKKLRYLITHAEHAEETPAHRHRARVAKRRRQLGSEFFRREPPI